MAERKTHASRPLTFGEEVLGEVLSGQEFLRRMFKSPWKIPCRAVSTFWIAHPNNNLINNAAAGSQDAGIWYLFHKEPTGESTGLQLLAKPELTPLGIFYNNRVHSNFKVGF